MDINAIIDRAKNVVLKPKETLEAAKAEQPSMQDLIIYVGIVAVPTLIGIIIGYGVVGTSTVWGHYRTPIHWALTYGIMQYVLSIIGVIVFGYIVNMLAPRFSSKRDQIQAMKLVAYAATPGLLAGILYIFGPIPSIGILVILASLYGLYILYLGIPVFMETPEDKRLIYLIVSFVVYIIIIEVISLITSAIMGPWNMPVISD